MVMGLGARDLNYPLPVVRTKKAPESIEDGDLTVLIERSDGCHNVRRFVESQGCKLTVDEKDSLFYIHIHKEKTEQPTSPKQSRDVIFITTDRPRYR